MKIVRWTGDQIPAVSCVVSTVQLKWQVTMVSREETMPVTSRWSGQIVLIASTIRNGQSTQIDQRDQRDMTDPDIISSGRKTMPIKERGQAPTRGAFVPNCREVRARHARRARQARFEVLGSKFQKHRTSASNRQPSCLSRFSRKSRANNFTSPDKIGV
jgi:hypothetical protein